MADHQKVVVYVKAEQARAIKAAGREVPEFVRAAVAEAVLELKERRNG